MQNDYKGTTKALMTLKKSKINFQGEDCMRKICWKSNPTLIGRIIVKKKKKKKKDGNRVSEAPDLGKLEEATKTGIFLNSLRCEQFKEPPTLQLPLRKLISAEVT